MDRERTVGRLAAKMLVSGAWMGLGSSRRGRKAGALVLGLGITHNDAAGVAAREVADAMSAADAIADGIEGMISEGGAGPGRYWKRSVLVRWRRMRRGGAAVRELWELLEDLVDGLEGYVSEVGDEGPYWKAGVLVAGRRASEGLLGLMRRGA
jgi:hypothetical protein